MEAQIRGAKHLMDQTQAEWSHWADGLRRDHTGRTSFPSPLSDGGIPAGWRVHSHRTDNQGHVQWCLVHRDAGGWLLLTHHLLLETTTLRWGRESLAAAYEMYQRDAERTDPAGAEARWLCEWFSGALVNLYDPTEATEAAEQTLFALSGMLRTPPRAALSRARNAPRPTGSETAP